MWALGLLGVNVVHGPIHLVDGELTLGQNAEPFTEQGEGGIRKRLGIDEFSDAALGAGIAAITSIPLPDPQDDALGGPGSAPPSLAGDDPEQTGVPGQTGVLEIFVDTGGAVTTRASADGTTWSNKSIAALADGFSNGGPPKTYFYAGKVYYAADALGQVRNYDGLTDALEATLPSTHPLNASPLTAVTGFAGIGDKLFVLCAYDSPYMQVMVSQIGSGVFTTFCEGFKSTAGVESGFILRTQPTGICAFDGGIFFGAYNAGATTGYLYRAGADDSAWTEDETFASRRPVTIGQAGTSLFFTTIAAAGSNYQIERRDASGTITVLRGPQATQPVVSAVHLERVYLKEGTNLFRSTDNGANFTQIATGTIGSGSGVAGKVTKLGSTYYLFLNTEFIRDDGAGVTEINVGGGTFLSGLVRF